MGNRRKRRMKKKNAIETRSRTNSRSDNELTENEIRVSSGCNNETMIPLNLYRTWIYDSVETTHEFIRLIRYNF